jgi:hypothetical protein
MNRIFEYLLRCHSPFEHAREVRKNVVVYNTNKIEHRHDVLKLTRKKSFYMSGSLLQSTKVAKLYSLLLTTKLGRVVNASD